jgi:hypothetical protein
MADRSRRGGLNLRGKQSPEEWARPGVIRLLWMADKTRVKLHFRSPKANREDRKEN